MKTLRIMFVCSGNICRSPLAAVMTKKKLQNKELPCAIISAGTLQINGEPAARFSQNVAQERELDLSHHRSQGVSKAFVDLCDFVVCMSPHHADYIQNLSSKAEVVKLWSYIDLPEIKDPVGKSIEAFRECRDDLDRSLDLWIQEFTHS